MNHYEAVFITTPVLSSDEYTRTVKKYLDFLEKNGGELVSKEDWGIKQLAYPIQKKTTGFYTLIEFKIDPQLIRRLEIEFKRDENIMRFLTVKLDKYAVKYAQQRKEKLSKKFEKTEG
ncbi:MAG: 30S ribosomal protein S6 [Chitinophagales bacterium]|nr:30S ribosomal protein S6 [Chitinophagales bacterium]MCZ2393451.1 30S ribosomal protein S6 [Chitinophagales bacterium]